MANHALLNNVDHKNLKIITTRSADYGDNVMSTMTFADEFRSVQAHYPIFFHKQPDTGRFQAAAIFGFEEGENLFLDEQGWGASYIPLTIERQPFLIGFQSAAGSGAEERKTVIHVDMDSPRISESEGEAVFLEHGGLTEYLNRINAVLSTINEGVERDVAFVDALLELELLESFTLDVELNDGAKYRMAGFYTINEEKLAELGGDALEKLHRAGHLQSIYMALASLSNIRDLIERRNARQVPSTPTDA